MLPRNTDILIVGAGPTGLALAATLSQAGIDHLLVDRLAAGQNSSRAAVIHAHTLEVVERIGAADEMVRHGLALDRFAVRDRDRPLLDIGFADLPTRYPFVLMITQDVTERLLAERLAALGGVVHRGVTATAIERQGEGVRARLETPDGPQQVTARYVVGGDGLHSVVREAAGLAFDGGTFEESFVLADLRMDWPLGPTEVSLYFAPAGLVVVAPLPGGAYRIVATTDEAPERPDRAFIQAILDARGPEGAAARIDEILWSSRFRVHHRLARGYRAGPFFVMGDAAHVHSPAGGQGMNTGIVDAVVLGELLSGVVGSGRPASDLDRYEALRRPAAEAVLGLSGRLTALATMHGAPRRLVRNTVLRLVDHLPHVRRELGMSLSGLARRANAEFIADRAADRRDAA